MPGPAANLLKMAAIAAALSLAGCGGGSDEAELAKLDNSIVGNDADPALTSALEDQIMVDPALTQQSNQLAVRRPGAPVQAQYPPAGSGTRAPAPTNAAAGKDADAMAELAQGRGTACGAEFDHNLGWARRLPAAFGIFPGGRVTEAAGNNQGDCRVRVVSYTSEAPAQRVLDWYHAGATRAGYSSEHQRREGDHILAGANGDAAFFLIVTPKSNGSDVSLIANNGR